VSEKVEQIMILYKIFKFKMTNLSIRNICRPSIQRRIKDKVPITSNNGLFKQRFRLEKVGQVSCNKALTITSNSRSVNSETRILRILPNIVHPCIASFRIIVARKDIDRHKEEDGGPSTVGTFKTPETRNNTQ
jgi:hypothetical protein